MASADHRIPPEQLSQAARCLREGGLVAFPTETVYGLGADAFNEIAVARIFEVKQRPRFDPLIVHIAELESLPLLAAGVPTPARLLMEHFWPGPLTLVLPRTARVPDLVTAGLPTVAIRMPRHAVARELIRQAGTPVAAPSANLFGRLSPTTARHVRDHLGRQVDVILDGGPCPVGVESTIISFASSSPVLLRPGGLPIEDVEALIGPLQAPHRTERPLAPGMLPRHYAPRIPLQVVSGALPPPPAGIRTGALAFQELAHRDAFAAVEILSPRGDLREAATHLFSALRRLEEQPLDLILAQAAPESGLGRAINDRLRRAHWPHPGTPSAPSS